MAYPHNATIAKIQHVRICIIYFLSSIVDALPRVKNKSDVNNARLFIYIIYIRIDVIAFNCSGGGATMEQHFCNFIVGTFPNESDDDSPKYKLIYIYIYVQEYYTGCYKLV